MQCKQVFDFQSSSVMQKKWIYIWLIFITFFFPMCTWTDLCCRINICELQQKILSTSQFTNQTHNLPKKEILLNLKYSVVVVIICYLDRFQPIPLIFNFHREIKILKNPTLWKSYSSIFLYNWLSEVLIDYYQQYLTLCYAM